MQFFFAIQHCILLFAGDSKFQRCFLVHQSRYGIQKTDCTMYLWKVNARKSYFHLFLYSIILLLFFLGHYTLKKIHILFVQSLTKIPGSATGSQPERYRNQGKTDRSQRVPLSSPFSPPSIQVRFFASSSKNQLDCILPIFMCTI